MRQPVVHRLGPVGQRHHRMLTAQVQSAVVLRLVMEEDCELPEAAPTCFGVDGVVGLVEVDEVLFPPPAASLVRGALVVSLLRTRYGGVIVGLQRLFVLGNHIDVEAVGVVGAAQRLPGFGVVPLSDECNLH